MKDKNEDIQKFLEDLPDKFDILEEAIDLQTQKEYIDYSHSFEPGGLSEEETHKLGNILFNPDTPADAKKKALALLAHLGTILAFRIIDKFCKIAGKETKQWAALALQECKMFLESSLTESSIGFISGGLGGDKNRMRFYFLILPLTDQPFTKAQKKNNRY